MKTAFIAVSLALLLSAALGEIQIDVTTPVQCERKTKAGDKIEVHYRGTLPSGEQFDASYDRGTPFSFKLGVGSVIRGWDQGLLGMCIGEKRTLTIPPEFAYGQRAMGSIPAGSTLIFQTELLGIDGVPKPEKIVAEKAPSAPTEEHAAKVEEAEAATEPLEPSTEHVADANKVADIAGKVADVIKTMLVDTDDSQDHNEL